MCYGCWESYDSPRIDNPLVREAARAIAEVYEFSCVGGNLHVVVDDWNLDSAKGDGPGELAFCRENDIQENIHEAGPEQLAAERRCLGLLERLTEDERASALALHNGFWEVDEPVV